MPKTPGAMMCPRAVPNLAPRRQGIRVWWRSLPAVVVVFGLVFSNSAPAYEFGDAFRVNGFGTLGLVYNADPSAQYVRDGGQPSSGNDRLSYTQDTLFGLQASYRANEAFSATMQLVSKYRYDRTYRPEVSWAFVSLNPNPDLTLRLGRVGLDGFFRADSRDVGYSYLLARPPVDYFGQLNMSRFDGLDVVGRIPLGPGILRAKFFAGLVNQTSLLRDDIRIKFNDSPVVGVLGDWQVGPWSARVGVAQLRIKALEPPQFSQPIQALRQAGLLFGVPSALSLADAIQVPGKRFRYYTFALGYDEGPLQVQLAASRVNSETLISPSNTAAYATVGWRVGRWTPYVLLSGVRSERPIMPPSGLGPAFDVPLRASLVPGQLSQYTFGAGVRFEVNENQALKFQLERIRSRNNQAFLWRRPQPDWDGGTTVFSATFDFIF